MKLTFLGSGNVATHLSRALHATGHDIVQIFSRTDTHASQLATIVGAEPITSVADIDTSADCYIYCLRDEVLQDFIRLMPPLPNAVHLHTAGSMPLDIFAGCQEHYGVLYPMQTFSKDAIVDFCHLPIFVEAHDQLALELAMTMARQLSDNVRSVNSEQRERLHVAAVFACNFTNHMYAQCQRILAEAGLPFEVMLPLIDVTAQKVHKLPPTQAQTGPAARHDTKIIAKHINMLSDKTQKQIYELISNSIIEGQKK